MITTEIPDRVESASQRVLFVAPAGADRDLYVTALRDAGFAPIAVPTAAAAASLFEAGESFQVVVTELLPDPDEAWSFIERRCAEQPDVPVIIVTSLIRPDRAQLRRSRLVGCAAFVAKPCSLEQMVTTVGFVLRGGRRLELLNYVEPGSAHIIE
jgi:DNA-binding NtrC family response regulator